MQRSDVAADVRLFIKATNASSRARGLGRGIVDLCERVEATGSLNKAAGQMGMAYSKAWRIIKHTEEALGVELFVRKGARGSVLTDDARVLVKMYRELEERLSKEADALLDEAFRRFEEEGLLTGMHAPEIEKKASPELIAQVRALETDHRRVSVGKRD